MLILLVINLASTINNTTKILFLNKKKKKMVQIMRKIFANEEKNSY